MIRGLTFKIQNEYSNFLARILRNIDISKYYWSISEDEIFNKLNNEFLFNNDKYNGIEFEKIINGNIYYIIFANIKAYLIETEYEDILNYDDFIKSNCQMIILCYDSEFIEIYCKDLSEIEIIKENARQISIGEIEYITDENIKEIL